MAETELEALNEIIVQNSTIIWNQNLLLWDNDVFLANQDLRLIELQDIEMHTNDLNYLEQQRELDYSIEEQQAVIENIQYQLDTSIQMQSFSFIFIGMIIGVLLITLVSRFWRNV